MAERLDEIRKRLAEATPGPWRLSDDNFRVPREPIVVLSQEEADWTRWVSIFGHQGSNNAEFIAHAPDDIAYLLARLEKAEAVVEVSRLVAALDDPSEHPRHFKHWRDGLRANLAAYDEARDG